ncbi:hypothetical protein AAHE18_14G152300 [Arachis hypogaea]
MLTKENKGKQNLTANVASLLCSPLLDSLTVSTAAASASRLCCSALLFLLSLAAGLRFLLPHLCCKLRWLLLLPDAVDDAVAPPPS